MNCVARDFSGAVHPDSGGDERDFAALGTNAETIEPLVVERRAISEASLEGGDFARKCVEDNDQDDVGA